MSDPISNAVNAALSSQQLPKIPSVPNISSLSKDDLMKKLPITKDPELIKKQIEGDILEKKAEAERLMLMSTDELIETGKQKLKELALAAIPYPPKLPFIDPKILQAVALAKQAKELWKQRQKLSKNNLKKAKDTYSFPMKPKKLKLQVPKIPELPTLPNLPSLPSLPSVPTLPSVPNIPNIK